MKYIKRYVDEELQDILECMGAVLIGPKWCGKTKKKLIKEFKKDISLLSSRYINMWYNLTYKNKKSLSHYLKNH